VKGRGNALSEPGSVQCEPVRLFNWAGSVQFWPGSSIPDIFTIFSRIFGHFSEIIQNLQNKIKSDKNLKNTIMTSIKLV